jgi:hypothetical protein
MRRVGTLAIARPEVLADDPLRDLAGQVPLELERRHLARAALEPSAA